MAGTDSESVPRRLMHVGSTWSVQIILLVAFAGYTAFASRVVDSKDFGIYAAAMAIANLGGVVAALGLSEVAARRVSETIDEDRTLIGVSILGGLAIGLLMLVAAVVEGIYNSSELGLILSLYAISMLWLGPGMVASAVLRRQGRFRVYNVVQFSSSMIALLGGCLLVVLIPSALALSAVPIVSGLLLALGMLAAIGRRAVPRLDGQYFRSAKGFAFRSLVLNLMVTGSNSLPVLAIGKALGAATLGSWNRALTVGLMPMELSVNSIASVTYPWFRHTRTPTPRTRARWTDAFSALGLVVLPVGFALVPVLPLVVRIALGPNWPQAQSMVLFIGIAGLGLIITRLVGGALQSAGEIAVTTSAQVINLLILGCGALAVLATGNWVAMAAAFSLSTWLQLAWLVREANKRGYVHAASIIRWNGLAASGGLLLAAATLVITTLSTNPAIELIAGLLIAAIGALPLLPRFRPAPIKRLLSDCP